MEVLNTRSRYRLQQDVSIFQRCVMVKIRGDSSGREWHVRRGIPPYPVCTAAQVQIVKVHLGKASSGFANLRSR
jgi:hypothetical protein